MSTYLDIETDRWRWDGDDERVEYLRVKVGVGRHVQFEHSYTDRDGTRRVDPCAGASFRLDRLDEIIDALQRIRKDFP